VTPGYLEGEGAVLSTTISARPMRISVVSLERDLFAFATRFGLDRVSVLSTFSALLSNIVSNVPAVLVFGPIVPRLAHPEQSWLTLAMSSTLAGNLTVVGSVANLIVLQRARHDVRISFWDYCRAGIPLTILSLAAGVAWLSLRQ
jgi:Na+/H+ antiporter NhaD/arsenite permease-like protein